jgi:ATP-dependent protease ClpP protease subunit
VRINFEGEINEESFNQFLSNMEEAEGSESIEFWISSSGGDLHISEAMLDILHRTPNVELIAYGDLSSAAFILFAQFKGEKRILPYAQSLIHVGTYGINVRSNGMLCKYQTQVQEYRKKLDDKFFEEVVSTWFLTKEQETDYLEGKDVFLPNEQIQLIIDSQKLKKLEHKATFKESDKVSNPVKRRAKRSETTD